ncbi:MAG: AMP-binding protein [Candidatus Bathyarchaeota archaeon]|jgi:long-chain acyl-CoA synthetase
MKSRHYPEGVPFSINYPNIPLYAFLENTARKYPSRISTLFYGNKLSYSRLWDESLRFAKALQDLGVEKGNRVALILPNVPQFIVAYYGILAAGGIVVPLNPLNPPEENRREIQQTEANILITLDKFLDKLPEATWEKLIVTKANAYTPWHLKVLDHLRGVEEIPKGSISFEELLKGRLLKETTRIDPAKDIAVVMYTSGTTGPPKGVMLTHRNLVANAIQSYHWLRGWGQSAKPQPAGWPLVVCAVPFFHAYGMTVALNESIQYGCTLILLPKPNPEAIMEAVQRHNATHLPAIPRFIREILEHPDLSRYDLKSLTSAVTGGSSIEEELVEKFEELTGANIYQGYGLTEAGPTTHCTPLEGPPNRRTSGLPFPDTKARIVDLQLGEIDLGPEKRGELLLMGPQIMKGYWRDPKATELALKGGWLHTGDIAYTDEEGFLYIVNRKQDRIIASGHTIWPTEVEEVLEAHPSVERAVAIGVLDPLKCATEVEVLVTLVKGADVNEKTLLEYGKSRLEYFQVPARITMVSSLPMTVFGKVDRVAVEALVEKAVTERVTHKT